MFKTAAARHRQTQPVLESSQKVCAATLAVLVNDAGLSYAVTGVAIDRDEERAHGQDERLGVQSFYIGNEFYYRYMKLLTEK